MNTKRIRIACMAISTAFVLLCSGFAFRGLRTSASSVYRQAAVSDGSSVGTIGGTSAGLANNLDIVQAVQEQAQNRSSQSSGILNSSMASRYQMILNGSDGEYYYLQDVTGDEVPELIAGEGILTVYTYSEGDIKSLGTVSGSNLYYSADKGILAEELSEGSYQMRSYQFDGELMMATIILSEKYQKNFEEKAETYRQDASPLTSFEITDRSALGG